LAASAIVLPAASRIGNAQNAPPRPVRIIGTFIAANVDGLLARLVSQSLSERLGEPVVVDNQPTIHDSTQAITNAAPDGHTLMLIIAANVIRRILDKTLNFDFAHDVAPVAGISRNPFVMVVNPTSPTTTVPDFISYAKSNAGKLKLASSGTGTIIHLAGELFKTMADIQLVHVPFQGLDLAVRALLGGDVEVVFSTMPSAIQHIRVGTLRALAVTGTGRSELLPDVPTVAEFLSGYEASGFQGLCAPKNTPKEIIDRLNKAVNAAVSDPDFRGRLGEFGNTVLQGSPADFGNVITTGTEKWDRVIRAANVAL
jgi:tripartite-type tricarboxylate transporter receptor subunit TctC